MSGRTGNLGVDAARIARDVAALAALTEPDRPYTRRAFTPMFDRGRAYLAQAFREAGLETRVDPAGNLIGRRPGRTPGLGTIMLGSHSDTVPSGGRYDGIAGVCAALEAARAFAESGVVLDHDLEVVDCLGEEVTIYGVSCVGSRGLAGALPEPWLERRAGERSLAEGIAHVGGDPARLAAARREDVRAWLELHIEQGPVLEREGIDLGVVTAIAGLTRVEIRCEGRADHAGTTPMAGRRDAAVAAARLVLAVEEIARALGGGEAHCVATVGELAIEPGAANIVPGAARLLVDARAERRADMETLLARLDEAVARIAGETGVSIAAERISDARPTPCDDLVMEAIEAGADAIGASRRRMASGAGHDAVWLAKIARAGMVFVPCAGGRSHAPEEEARIEDVALGAAALAEATRRLDRALQGRG